MTLKQQEKFTNLIEYEDSELGGKHTLKTRGTHHPTASAASKELSPNALRIFDIIKKYDFVNNPEAFKILVNTTEDKTIQADGLDLEIELNSLGMHLKADGKIDENTIVAVQTLIRKNEHAIVNYKKHFGIDPIKKEPVSGR